MDYNSTVKQLRQYSQDLIAYKMGAEFADACNDATDAIERLSAELERATKERCKLQELAHSQRNGLEQLRVELEQVKRERDAAVEEIPHTCIKCKKCYQCAKQWEDGWHGATYPCGEWEWRGPQKEE